VRLPATGCREAVDRRQRMGESVVISAKVNKLGTSIED